MLDLKYNETMLSKVEKGRVAHSSPSDGKQSGGVSCVKMMKQDIHMKIGEVIMVQTIKISSKEMKLINDLLNLTGDEIYQKYGYKRDETITHTTKFSNGVEADIKLVICEDEHPYTEGVLFHNGFELTCTEPGCTYDGEWNFECNGIEYTVFVEVED